MIHVERPARISNNEPIARERDTHDRHNRPYRMARRHKDVMVGCFPSGGHVIARRKTDLGAVCNPCKRNKKEYISFR